MTLDSKDEFLTFEKILGSSSQKVLDLLLMDQDTLAFSSGKFLYFFNVNTKTISSRRCTKGTDIGCITKNHVHNHLTIAENGCEPKIFIHQYPSMNLIAICANGAKNSYVCLGYNATGELLASQGGAPNFAITIWHWKTATIVLHSGSILENVFDLKFSHRNDRHLFTGGVKHIRFWDVTHTFTGLKLLNKSGRFGKFKICDILSICPEAENRILTNCDWGNILVWENGKIKFEVCQKNRQPCHQGSITQISCHNKQILTIGRDNYMRIWFWDTVTLDNLRENERIVEFESTYEYQIGTANICSDNILSFTVDAEKDHLCYVYDGNGVIWKSFLNKDLTTHHAEILFRSNASGLVDIAVSPFTNHIVTLNHDGGLCLYNYINGNMLFYHRFSSVGYAIIWATQNLDPMGKTLFLGFLDGVIRVICLDVDEIDIENTKIYSMQFIKPHAAPITILSVNSMETILISSSEDKTIFMFNILNENGIVRLDPIGFVILPVVITAITWVVDTKLTANVLFGGFESNLFRIEIPTSAVFNEHSYFLEDVSRKIEKLQLHPISNKCDAFTVHQIIAVKEYAWILLSSGQFFEYDLKTGACSIINDASQAIIQSLLVFDKNFAIFGHSNGEISVQKIDWNSSLRFTVQFVLSATEHFDSSRLIKLRLSYDKNYLFVFGSDGYITLYKWSTKTSAVLNLYEYSPCKHQHLAVLELSRQNYLTLEQQKQISIANDRAKKTKDKKAEILEIFGRLKNEFYQIKVTNTELPKAMQLPPISFEIDKRITEDLKNTSQCETKAVCEEIETKMNIIKSLGKRLENVCLGNADSWPTILSGISNHKSVETFLIVKKTDEFEAITVEFEDREKEYRENTIRQASKYSEIKSNATVTECSNLTAEISVDNNSQQTSFINSLALSTDKSNFDIQAKRLYSKYVERKHQELERKKQWKHIGSIAPISLPAKNGTTGNLGLESQTHIYDAEESSERVIFEKYLDLKSLQRTMKQLKQEFNCQLLKAKDDKFNQCSYLKYKIKILDEIQKELFPDQQKSLQIISNVEETIDFIEGKFRIGTLNVLDIRTNEMRDPSYYSEIEMTDIDIRLANMLKKHSLILTDIESKNCDFNIKINTLMSEKLKISLRIKFIELHYYVVYQELMILEKFRKPQQRLLDDLTNVKICMDQLEQKICTAKLTLKEIMGQRKDDGTVQGVAAKQIGVNNNTKNEMEFEEFFRSNDVSDSLSIEDQLLTLKQIKSVKNGFQSDSLRAEAVIENLECLFKKWIAAEKDLQASRRSLNMLLYEKQTSLNDIDTIIVLPEERLKVIRHDMESNNRNIEEDNVLVNKNKISKLYERVNEYATETTNELETQRSFIAQLAQIKGICTNMHGKISKLKGQVTDAMGKKFGTIVDLDEMEEAILKRLLHNQPKNYKMDEQYEKGIVKLKKRIEGKSKELLLIKQEQVEKLNLLVALQEESNIIKDELNYQKKLRGKHSVLRVDEFNKEKDFERLSEILRQQKEQIKAITKEIQTLRLKIRPKGAIKFYDTPKHLQSSHQSFMLPERSTIDIVEGSVRSESASSKFISRSKVTNFA